MDSTYKQWINVQLEPLGESVEHIEPVRTSPGSAVFSVLANGHRCYYLKTCSAPFTHEPLLAAALDSWMPGSVPHVLAVDTARHWLLMVDAGPSLRTRIQDEGDTTLSDEMLRRFAALQQEMIPRQEELLRMGVPDRRLEYLPAFYDELIADTPALLIGQKEGVSTKELEQLRAFAPIVRQLCQQLADYNLPETLQHDDFHTANVSHQFHFFDWGECYKAHPFYSLLIALRDARFTLEYDPPTLDRMRNVYLECWTEYAPFKQLHEVLAITNQLAALGRALSWWQIIQHADDAYRAENADAVPYWLLTFLHNTPLD
ncbi:phosphotransferase [Chloroflexota bacterium]